MSEKNIKKKAKNLFVMTIIELKVKEEDECFCFVPGNLCMITGGRNLGRVGTVVNRERHPGSFDIVHIKDTQGHTFATR